VDVLQTNSTEFIALNSFLGYRFATFVLIMEGALSNHLPTEAWKTYICHFKLFTFILHLVTILVHQIVALFRTETQSILTMFSNKWQRMSNIVLLSFVLWDLFHLWHHLESFNLFPTCH